MRIFQFESMELQADDRLDRPWSAIMFAKGCKGSVDHMTRISQLFAPRHRQLTRWRSAAIRAIALSSVILHLLHLSTCKPARHRAAQLSLLIHTHTRTLLYYCVLRFIHNLAPVCRQLLATSYAHDLGHGDVQYMCNDIIP
ncbi:hypothetical protein IF1G_02189 [Cordyceps javanica]|uniref:Uncharacterized protein n=1 Tax=Cordyceps javanica TaxID=43265 RepID=A0A545VE45_9HYPO|nr:hypothetical protein IF1G_02189 [Cordyceps javanica]